MSTLEEQIALSTSNPPAKSLQTFIPSQFLSCSDTQFLICSDIGFTTPSDEYQINTYTTLHLGVLKDNWKDHINIDNHIQGALSQAPASSKLTLHILAVASPTLSPISINLKPCNNYSNSSLQGTCTKLNLCITYSQLILTVICADNTGTRTSGHQQF
jgi:hypothetical protein